MLEPLAVRGDAISGQRGMVADARAPRYISFTSLAVIHSVELKSFCWLLGNSLIVTTNPIDSFLHSREQSQPDSSVP